MSTDKRVVARCIDGSRREVLVSEMQFRVSVYGVVLNDESVLLVPQWDGYDIPGGGIDLGESTRDALIREVFEETGLHVTPDMSTALHVQEDFFIHPTRDKPYHTFLLFYRCENPIGEISDEHLAEDEKKYAKAAQWVPVDSVSNLKFYNPVDSPAIIEAARRAAGKRR